MAAVKELIRTEQDGTISFGDYELSAKTKKADYPHDGDIYKVKTFREMTHLERNELFVYESVPGTAVESLTYTEDGMTFTVEGPEDAQITIEAEPETEYNIFLNEEEHDRQKSSLGGKLTFSVELSENAPVKVRVAKA